MAPQFSSFTSGRPRRTILLTCYMTGATSGKNLGTAGYSYDFVAQLFIPLLSQFGEVIPVPDPRNQLESYAEQARQAGQDPVHVSFLPIQDMPICSSCPNIVVPAWEFPDVPDQPFSGNPQNDWPTTAERCAAVWVGGPFTQVALEKSGTRTPIHIVPVPTPDEYFAVPLWDAQQRVQFDARSYAFPVPPRTLEKLPAVLSPKTRAASPLKRFGKSIERSVRHAAKNSFGPAYEWLRTPSKAMRSFRASLNQPKLPIEPVSSIDLSGVVYASIFNPGDGRKNWPDLLTAFLLGLGDKPDATLVIKLISGIPADIDKILRHYLRRGISHQCKLYFVTGFLSPAQMVEMARASTYYYQTTKAEGNCLPLMNYLAAGRPAVSPRHSAIGDYFSEEFGFVVESHPEPAAWPHDPLLRTRTTWGRLIWPSIVEQLRESYRVAKFDAATYYGMAEAGRRKLAGWASSRAVLASLERAFAALEQPAATVRRAA